MHTVTHGGNVTNRLSTTDELAAMRARADEATEGPWTASGEWAGSWGVTYTWRPGTELAECSRVLDVSDMGDACGDQGDAEFVAHARTDMPRLLDAVEAVVAILNEYPPPNADAVGEYSLVENARRAVAARIRRSITSALEASE